MEGFCCLKVIYLIAQMRNPEKGGQKSISIIIVDIYNQRIRISVPNIHLTAAN
jgi:hypothetical protein